MTAHGELFYGDSMEQAEMLRCAMKNNNQPYKQNSLDPYEYSRDGVNGGFRYWSYFGGAERHGEGLRRRPRSSCCAIFRSIMGEV